MAKINYHEPVSVYILLKDHEAVYVGIGGIPEHRVAAHRRKGWDFDDIIENSHGPLERSKALRLERILIIKLCPSA